MNIEGGKFKKIESLEERHLRLMIEELEAGRERATKEMVTDALSGIEKTYGSKAKLEDRLLYHDENHTRDVIRRVNAIFDVLEGAGTQSQARRVATLSAAYHDFFQHSQAVSQPDGRLLRVRNPAHTKEKELSPFYKDRVRDEEEVTVSQIPLTNEELSAKALVQEMEAVNQFDGKILFTDTDQAEVTRAIVQGTTPAYDPELKTVYQKGLEGEESPVVLSLALADLAGAGMDGPEKYREEGDKLFFEENIDITQFICESWTRHPDEEEPFRQRILKWSDFQVAFAEGRKQRFEKELQAFPEKVQSDLRRLFSRFDDSIAAAKEEAALRKDMTFAQLVTRMRFPKELSPVN